MLHVVPKGAAEAGWREEILREFTPGVARLTVATDPDGLLLEMVSGAIPSTISFRCFSRTRCSVRDVSGNPRLELCRQGLDEDVVMLKEVRGEERGLPR